MATSTTTLADAVARMAPVDRSVLELFREGVGPRAIGLRVDLEQTDVQETINQLAGGDRERAGRVVAAYDRAHGTTPVSAPTGGGVRRAADLRITPGPPAKSNRTATAGDAVAPVVVAADLPLEPAGDVPVATIAPVDLDDALAAVTDPAPEPAEPVDVEDGPVVQLPAVDSFESLIAAVAGSGSLPLAELAGEVTAALDRLHDAYDRERHRRALRAEIADLRAQLADKLACLAGITDPPL